MASGATITADGMVTMTQVVAGTDVVEDADFNNARTNIDRLLGTAFDQTLGTYDPTFSYGYDQGGAGVGAASVGSTILATGANGAFKDLQDDIQALCAFLGETVRTGVGTDVVTGNTITATTWNNLMLNIQDCWNGRFAPAATSTTTDGTATRTTLWNNSLNQITSWTFSTESNCRAFFNAGGGLGVSASRTGGSSNNQNTDWTNLLSAMGTVYINYNNTVNGGSIGFYELTTSYQTIHTETGTAPYAGDTAVIQARVNSTTNPTIVYLQTTLTDATDGVIDTGVDGTLTINARRIQPSASGSGFSITAPTDSAGGITGS